MLFKCNICKSTKKEYVYRKVRGYDTPKSYALVRCGLCGTTQTYPIPSQDQLAAYYGDQSIAFNGSGGDAFVRSYIDNKSGYWKKLKLHKRLKEIQLHAPAAHSILDVGCGAGIFIDYLRSKEYSVQGIELSEWGHTVAAKELRLKVHNKQLMQAGLKKNTLDVVTMYDLLEHTINPAEELAYLHKLLKKDGLLVLNVPNFNSFISSRTKSQWNKLIPPNHLYHFTIESLSSILQNNGFKIVAVSTNNGDAREFGGQLLMALFVSLVSLGYPALRKSYKQMYTKSERESVVNYKLIRGAQKMGQMLWFLFVPLIMGLNLIKKGEGIHIVARRVSSNS